MEAHTTTSLQNTPRSRSPRQLSIIALGIVSAFLLVIQVIPYGHNHVNPPVAQEPAWNSPQTRALFFRACADCHSNQTEWPWYTNVAPVSWLATRDVVKGRAKFNISEWGRPKNEADDAAKTVVKGSMPPWFYTPLHPTANLTTSERQQLIDGLTATFGGEGGNTSGNQSDSD